MSFLTGQLVKNILNLGVLMTPRPQLNFLGTGWSMVDNPGNNSTDITFTSSSALAQLWTSSSTVANTAFITEASTQMVFGAYPGGSIDPTIWLLPSNSTANGSNWFLTSDGATFTDINAFVGFALLFSGNPPSYHWAPSTGTINSQAVVENMSQGTCETVSSATPKQIIQVVTASGKGGVLWLTALSRATTTGAGIAVGDCATSTYMLGYRNIAGTVTLSTAGITLVTGSNQTTVAALTAPVLTASVAGNTITILVTNVALCTIDSQVRCDEDRC